MPALDLDAPRVRRVQKPRISVRVERWQVLVRLLLRLRDWADVVTHLIHPYIVT